MIDWVECFGCRRIHTLIGHRAEISSAQFNWDCSLIATGSMDKTVKIWDPANGISSILPVVGLELLAMHWDSFIITISSVLEVHKLSGACIPPSDNALLTVPVQHFNPFGF